MAADPENAPRVRRNPIRPVLKVVALIPELIDPLHTVELFFSCISWVARQVRSPRHKQ